MGKEMSRCISRVARNDGVYRCIFESGDGHTEHQYNFYRRMTPGELAEVEIQEKEEIGDLATYDESLRKKLFGRREPNDKS